MILGVKSRGNQIQASKGLFPEESQMTIFMKCSRPGKLIRDSVPRAMPGAWVTQVLSAWHITEVQTPRRKTGIQYKACC